VALTGFLPAKSSDGPYRARMRGTKLFYPPLTRSEGRQLSISSKHPHHLPHFGIKHAEAGRHSAQSVTPVLLTLCPVRALHHPLPWLLMTFILFKELSLEFLRYS